MCTQEETVHTYMYPYKVSRRFCKHWNGYNQMHMYSNCTDFNNVDCNVGWQTEDKVFSPLSFSENAGKVRGQGKRIPLYLLL